MTSRTLLNLMIQSAVRANGRGIDRSYAVLRRVPRARCALRSSQTLAAQRQPRNIEMN